MNSVLHKIKMIQGDITTFQGDAIVNAANNQLAGGGGVDGAIHRAAGPSLLKESLSKAPCSTGEARITKAYQLSCKYVIHTVGPVYRSRGDESELLAKAYDSCFVLADQYQIKSLAFPAISCGVYGFPHEEASRIALGQSIINLKKYSDIETIVFYLFSADMAEIYQNLYNQLSRKGHFNDT